MYAHQDFPAQQLLHRFVYKLFLANHITRYSIHRSSGRYIVSVNTFQMLRIRDLALRYVKSI